LFSSLLLASGHRSKIKNPSPFHGKGFFLVDKRFEISNLTFIKNMRELVELAEVL
jgi:hypothetical protein